MKKPRLLLIVDNWELLERYDERFSTGFDVLCAPLGSEGIRMAREEAPDFVFLNLSFENMTNEEACATLRADPLTRELPIVAAGANGHGPDRWLKEPISIETLLEALTSLKSGS